MSLPITHTEIRNRCQILAHQISNDLAGRQRADGQFELPDFYAMAFAINLWTRIDPNRFSQNIDRAVGALASETKDKTYHREFIEFALRDTPGMSRETVAEILRGTKQQRPDVANWQMLGMINWQKRNAGLAAKFFNLAHFAFIIHRYWRKPAFLDRPDCFSAQYHAFCAALLSDSINPKHQPIANQATEMIAQLTGTHGFANLLGRGAGQSFGSACALYALMKIRYFKAADAVLFRMEDAYLRAGQLPLNLLAPVALPDQPGLENPQTPGWYSYNRHDDYLAFAGYWLLKASLLPVGEDHRLSAPANNSSPFLSQFSSPHYHAQMTLAGKQGFDVSGAPVIVSGQGKAACILLPPTGGEQDAPSLYDQASQPLPAFAETTFSRFLGATRQSDNRIDVTFELAGKVCQRHITFDKTRVIICDHVPDLEHAQIDLFRILIDGNIALSQISENTVICPEAGVKFTANAPLQISPKAAFSAAGTATRISARPRNGHSATLTIAWEKDDA
jgi:hypothetical protein